MNAATEDALNDKRQRAASVVLVANAVSNAIVVPVPGPHPREVLSNAAPTRRVKVAPSDRECAVSVRQDRSAHRSLIGVRRAQIAGKRATSDQHAVGAKTSAQNNGIDLSAAVSASAVANVQALARVVPNQEMLATHVHRVREEGQINAATETQVGRVVKIEALPARDHRVVQHRTARSDRLFARGHSEKQARHARRNLRFVTFPVAASGSRRWMSPMPKMRWS
ncbi:MAG TPA: hypothetical protein VD837_17505 [Terriglobales bacterium]|nr:hypothetical protein [Terriglobales bacterium]